MLGILNGEELATDRERWREVVKIKNKRVSQLEKRKRNSREKI